MKRNRRTEILVPEKYEPKIKALLCGDYAAAKHAKYSLMMSAQNLERKNPEEARLLKRIYRRVKL